MKILNLYAGIGGNRKNWGDEHEITAIENVPEIAKIYADFFPNDVIILADAHEYLAEHYMDFDFIWSSPPCPTHSRLRTLHEKKIYPDLKLYEEIIFLKSWFKGKWIVENVTAYYDALIPPSSVQHRHWIWSNFHIGEFIEHRKLKTGKAPEERKLLQEEFGFNLDKYTGVDKRKLLRNCVVPEMGQHILKEALKETPKLF